MRRRIAGAALAAIVALTLPVLASCGTELGDPVAVADTPSGAEVDASASAVDAAPAASPSSVAPTPTVLPAASTTEQSATEPPVAAPSIEQPATESPSSDPSTTEPSSTESASAAVQPSSDQSAAATADAGSAPAVEEISPYLSSFCPTTPHAVAVDRDRQSAWLCEDGRAVYEFPFTGAITQPDPGTYPVYAKDLDAFSTLSGSTSFMRHFVAFTYGKYQGARVAFHSVPTSRDGTFLQPLESVGDVAMRGESAGCLRVLPDDAVKVWDWLAIGDEVRIIN